MRCHQAKRRVIKCLPHIHILSGEGVFGEILPRPIQAMPMLRVTTKLVGLEPYPYRFDIYIKYKYCDQYDKDMTAGLWV